MDKLTVFALLVLLTISAVCDARPALLKKLPKLKQPSAIRKAALYVNPFDWIGTPTWPHRTVKKKTNKSSEKRHRYRWFVEVDESNHWWVSVYENESQVPGPGKKIMMKLF